MKATPTAVFTGLLIALAMPIQAEGGRHETDEATSTRWQWLGVKANPTEECPDPGGPWQTGKSFPNIDSASPLSKYCTFTFAAGQPVTPADEALLQSLSPAFLSELGTDVMGLGSFALPLEASLWHPLAQAFREQVGAIDLASSFTSPPVRLAVLDTHPTANFNPMGLPSNSAHGYSLLAMAQNSLCSEEDPSGAGCIVQLTSRLALSYVSFDPLSLAGSVQDLNRGGYVGTISELAEAINAEVSDWAASGVDQKLVLNLSVGWNPRFGGLEGHPSLMPVPVRMVYDAIRDARCRGALVVAATGNRSGGSSSSAGPMMPAAWATHPAPIERQCGRGEPTPTKAAPAATAPEPLLYAAAGARSNGEPLANSRPGSMPERLAFGDHAVVRSPTGEPTAILTGSSVAALVTSSAAAAAWYFSQELPAHRIMATVDGAGNTLPMTSDFCFSQSSTNGCQTARRVSICSSIVASCENSLYPCPALACQPWDPSPPNLSENLNLLSPTLEMSLSSIDEVYVDAEVCEPTVALFDPANGPSPDPCPDLQYASVEASPWVHPQPGSHACPPCRVHRETDQLIIEIDDQLTGVVSQPTLNLCGVSYSLGDIPLNPGATTIVNNVDTAGCDQATVSFTVTENGTTYSSIDSALIVD